MDPAPSLCLSFREDLPKEPVCERRCREHVPVDTFFDSNIVDLHAGKIFVKQKRRGINWIYAVNAARLLIYYTMSANFSKGVLHRLIVPYLLISRRTESEDHRENRFKQPEPDPKQDSLSKALCQIQAVHKCDHCRHDIADAAPSPPIVWKKLPISEKIRVIQNMPVVHAIL